MIGKLLFGPIVYALYKGWPYHIDITRYELLTPKVKTPVKFVVLADVHDTYYGDRMEQIVDIVHSENPDFIVLPGDLCQENTDNLNSFKLLEELKDYPMFYCTGNHEEEREDLASVKNELRKRKVNVLESNTITLQIEDTLLEIGGISSREYYETQYQPWEVNRIFKTNYFRMLLSHQPQWVELYKNLECDLTVCGHAHGGQFCIPNTKIGIAAPQQGFFPKYTEGIHQMGNNTVLISRGLAWHYHGIPRLFNNPELVVCTLRSK